MNPNLTISDAPSIGKGSKCLSRRLLLVFSLLVISLSLLQLALFKDGRDQGIYSVVADAILRGECPYRDVWDFKPPGIYFIYALARGFLGCDPQSARLFEVFFFILLVLGAAFLSKRHLGDYLPGVMGGALAVLCHVNLEFWHTGQPESYGGVVIVWAILASTYRPSKENSMFRVKQFAAWASAGALYTFAALCKPALGGGFCVSLFLIGREIWKNSELERDRWREIIQLILIFVSGALIVLGIFILYFGIQGSFSEIHGVFIKFLPNYVNINSGEVSFFNILFRGLQKYVFGLSLGIIVGLSLFMFLPALSTREWFGTSFILGNMAVQLLGIILQGKFFEYHFGAVLILSSILAGWGLFKIYRLCRYKSISVLIFLLIIAFQLNRCPEWAPYSNHLDRWQFRIQAIFENDAKRQRINDYLHSLGSVNAGANRLVAEWINEHLTSDESVFIWGFEPTIYVLTQRAPNSKYIYNLAQRIDACKEMYRSELMDQLAKRPPEIIIVERGDIIPQVTGNFRDSYSELKTFPQLLRFLKLNYKNVKEIEDLIIFKKVDN